MDKKNQAVHLLNTRWVDTHIFTQVMPSFQNIFYINKAIRKVSYLF